MIKIWTNYMMDNMVIEQLLCLWLGRIVILSLALITIFVCGEFLVERILRVIQMHSILIDYIYHRKQFHEWRKLNGN